MDVSALLKDVLRASGLRLARGRLTIPTPRLVEVARAASAKAMSGTSEARSPNRFASRGSESRAIAVESIDLVPGDGEVRIHLVLKMMGDATRVVVRASIASLHLASVGGALRLRLLEAPTFGGKNGGKGAQGMLGMLGAFGQAALSSMGPEGIAQTVAQYIGPPLSAHRDLLSIDLGAIPSVRKLLLRETPVGRVGEIVHVTGASFHPGGLEVALHVRPRPMLTTLASSFMSSVIDRWSGRAQLDPRKALATRGSEGQLQ